MTSKLDWNDCEGDAERAHTKRAAKQTIADFLECERHLATKSTNDQRVELLRLVTAIDFLREELLAWAKGAEV
jgi:hypothetical protein